SGPCRQQVRPARLMQLLFGQAFLPQSAVHAEWRLHSCCSGSQKFRRSVGTRKVDAFIEVTLGSTAVACVSDGYQIFAALFDAQRNTCSLYILRTDDDLWTECIHAFTELGPFRVSS